MHYYIINFLVNYFPWEGQCKLSAPLLSLRLTIFINESLLSFCRCLQDPLPAAHVWVSMDVFSQLCHLCPHPCMAQTAMALFATTWEGRQHFKNKCAIPDKKEGEWLKPGVPQSSVFLVSSWVSWEDGDLQAALCKQFCDEFRPSVLVACQKFL